ncbi:MAG TPA: hypothetical protein VGF04_08135 [Solirubrobacterales bacterium]
MRGAEEAHLRADSAIRYYLSDKHAERAEWPFPAFLRQNGDAEKPQPVVSVDRDLWSLLEQEAARQGVPAELLAQHAVLYFAADRDTGRVSQRIRAA